SLWPLRYSLRLTTTSPGRVTNSGLSAFFLRLSLNPASAGSFEGSVCRVVSWLNSSSEGASSPDCSSFSPIAGLSVLSVERICLSASSSAANTNRAASASSGSSMVMVTSAMPRGGRLVVPLKMQSDMRSARRVLWLCSPSTQLMASTTLDFPQPFGPTMQVLPIPLNVTTVRSQKDLKPTISTFRSLSKVSPFVVNFHFAAYHYPQTRRVTHCHRTAARSCKTATVLPREERRLSFPRGEGFSSDASVCNRQKANTFGRFSFRGPAAWR